MARTESAREAPALLSAKELQGYHIHARDGDIGRVTSFLFDDETWDVRYLLVKTGILFGKEVLIAPTAMTSADWETRSLTLDLTKQQIKESPPIDNHLPVSREHELMLARHYGWPTYWGPVPVYGQASVQPQPVEPEARPLPEDARAAAAEKAAENHLQSSKDVIHYHVQALDGAVGHIEDLILDTVSWRVRWGIVDTRNWLPGRKVLLSPSWITKIDAKGQLVFVDLSQEQIEASPEFDPSIPVNRHYEVRLYDYYGRPAYW